MDLDLISTNPCEGIKSLYSVNRAAIIWTPDDIKAVKAVASPEVGYVIDLAVHTGLRAGDLARLSWAHISADAICIPTGKSRGSVEAVVPLYDGLRAVLATIPKRSTVVLTNEAGKPWKAVNGTSFSKARDKALPGKDLHFHDLRGTAATKFYLAGLKPPDIAEIMGWETAKVEKIIRRYVGSDARTAAIIQQLNQTQRGT
ncbi:MAG: site-specific integrase [Brevundimonas sp.]|uniref:site-specific integrase n=1 Tax=Brevundimonas sp. TaxID=1871086 RepID=UPI003919BDF9